MRASTDVRRDFARCSSGPDAGGTFSFGEQELWVEKYQRSLHALGDAISKFENLLKYQANAKENVFHDFLELHPILLDVYGTVVSKPRFTYPEETKSPIGKGHLEPDFIITYPNKTYKLVELERASKKLSTRAGHARQDLAQAAFQIAEWKSYIARHYGLIKDKFPNISQNSPSLIVLSLDSQNECKTAEELEDKIDLLKQQFNVDEILTYDGVLRNARTLYDKLSNLGL